eukprot:13708267-Alexandrium_andersonii.AAC.1
MSASLVGSEMCIRDRRFLSSRSGRGRAARRSRATVRTRARATRSMTHRSVSYTHLTLPTICSV